jgi:hypothetical protein
VDQISFFSAEASGPALADLAGVLCGQGQIVSFGRTAARLSVAVDEAWRARILATEFARRGVHADIAHTKDGQPLVRTAFRADLMRLANTWHHGDGKELPTDFRLTGGALRLWALAGGCPDDRHYLFTIDEDVPVTHARLADAFRHVGLPAQLVGPGAGGPAIRVTGRRRLATLEELLGAPPAGAASLWPQIAPAKRLRPESGSAA